MPMDIIQSYFDNKKCDIRQNMSLVPEQANISCKLCKKHNYTVVLYTSKNLQKFFKHIPYDDIILIEDDEYLDIIKYNFWSGTKLVACNKHKNPYLHLDTDLFLIENVLADKISSNFLVLHSEPWLKNYLKLDQELCQKIFNLDVTTTNSYNCGIFGGQQWNQINSIISNVLGKTTVFAEQIQNIVAKHLNTPDKNWITSVFLEQIITVNLIKDDLKTISTIINTDKCKEYMNVYEILQNNNIIHLWLLKNCVHKALNIQTLMRYMEKYYF
jgi:hypothetical protein